MAGKKVSREVLISLVLGVVGFISMLGIIIFLLLSKGILGWIEYEYLGLIALLLLCAFPVSSIVMSILSIYKGKKIHVATDVIGGLSLVVAIAFATFFSVTGNITGLKANLSFYASTDGNLSSTNSLKVAVASDSHWGKAKSNPEARNKIMDYIASNSYDLMVHGGDVVDLGMMKSHYVEAINDMEAHMPNQKVHFVMGNHDALVNGERNFMSIFQPGEVSPSHVLNLAPKVHWVVFNMIWDEIEVKDSELKWLDETLSSFPSDHCVIVESHGYYYATGDKSGYGEWYDRQKTISRICPIFEKNNVDLVISGHVHSMEFMKANNVYYALVGPFGGTKFPDDRVKTKAESHFLNGTDYGFTEVDIHDDSTIEVTYRNEFGTGLYAETIHY